MDLRSISLAKVSSHKLQTQHEQCRTAILYHAATPSCAELVMAGTMDSHSHCEGKTLHGNWIDFLARLSLARAPAARIAIPISAYWLAVQLLMACLDDYGLNLL